MFLGKFSRKDWGALTAVLAFILLFVAPALGPKRVFAPLDLIHQAWAPWQMPNQPESVENLLLSDVVTYIVPVRHFWVEAVKDGEWPLWNPYLFTGNPFTYNTQAAVYYPLTWLNLILPLTTAIDMIIILQLILGAVFMFLYLRHLNLKPMAVALGAFLFVLNGFMIIWLEWQVVHTAVIWLPLQLYLIEQLAEELEKEAVNRKKLLFLSLLSGIIFGVPWLGGHWNWTIISALTIGVYTLWRLAPLFASQTNKTVLWLPFAGTFGIGAGLPLVQILPAFFYLSQSHRTPLSYSEALLRALHDRFVVLVIPNFFGNPIAQNWWGNRNFAETTFYIGILPIFLALFAIWFRRRDRRTLFFAVWGFLGLLWAVGSPIYRPIHMLPIFNGLFPSRMIYLFVFCGTVLSAFGLDALLRWRPLPKSTKFTGYMVVFFVTVLLVGIVVGYSVRYQDEVTAHWAYLRPYFALATLFLLLSIGLFISYFEGLIRPVAFGTAVIVLVVVDLYAFGHDYNTVSQVDEWFTETAVARFLKSDPTHFRITSLSKGIVYPPNSSMMDHIQNLSGYEPGIWMRSVEYLNTAEGANTIVAERVLTPSHALESPMLDVLNVKYIVTSDDLWQEASRLDIDHTRQDLFVELSEEGLTQQFTVKDAGFHRADLLLQSSGNSGSIQVKIFTADGILELANSELPLSELPKDGWSSFYFSAFPSEWGRDFLLKVMAFDNDQPVTIGVSTEDTYANGRILSEPAQFQDITFSTFYLPRPELLFEDGTTKVYANQGFFDRATLIPQAVLVNTAEEAFKATSENAERLHELVILETGAQDPPPSLGFVQPINGTVEITEYEHNKVVLQTTADVDSFLLLSDTNYPGWRASIDGEKTAVYTANGLLRAIYLPKGSHQVLFFFQPPDFIVGAIISTITLIICLAGLWLSKPRV